MSSRERERRAFERGLSFGFSAGMLLGAAIFFLGFR